MNSPIWKMFHRTSNFLSHNILRTIYAKHFCWISLTSQASIPYSYNINSFRNHKQCINYFHCKLLSPRSTLTSRVNAFSLSAHHQAKDRNEDFIDPRRDVFAQYDDVFRSCSKRSMLEWEGIASAGVETGLASQVCDALVLKKCITAGNYSLGNSYMEFVEQHQQREPTAGCLALYMDLCTLGHQECGELPILSAFERLSSRLPAFPTGLAVRVVLALSQTSRWREGLPHIEDIRRRGETIPANILAAICRAAFESGDGGTGWEMLEQVCRKRYSNMTELIHAFDHYCNSLSQEDCDAAVQRLLGLAGVWQVYPDAASAQELAEVLCRRGWAVHDTPIGDGGQCQRCGELLKHESIPEDSFLKLKEDILERVLKRDDIFQVTSPKELESFNKLVDHKGPFTHLLDGLNIGFMRAGNSRHRQGKSRDDSRRSECNRAMAENVLKIIDDILRDSPKANMLVIARDHMRRWHRPTMMQVHMKATVFYLQNVTLDDSYFLYAALHSGPDTKIVTNDLLRNHQFRLGSGDEQQRIFRLWIQRVQQIISNSPLSLQPLTPFTVTAQHSESGQRWHLPYDDGSLEFSYQLPHSWLCMAPSGLVAKQVSSAQLNLVSQQKKSATEQPNSDVLPKIYSKSAENSAGVTHHKDANRNSRFFPEITEGSSHPSKIVRNEDHLTNSKNKYEKRRPKLDVDFSKFFSS